MAKKKKKLNFYSTNPDAYFEDEWEDDLETPDKKEQILRVSLDRKKRNGKEVSLVKGFIGHEDDLKDLSKLLKRKCGVGGSTKDQEIIIQGNMVDKIVDILLIEGYSKTKRSGG